ncbi:MAG: carbon-nitrogen hydrolase family protein [Oscillospiraceae bacterium]|nr:carbon-nitrogen hydrolase family protein [Oscillospiraceae bacterium]
MAENQTAALRALQWQMRTRAGAEALSGVEAGCRRARELGADLLTLPEMFCCPYETVSFPRFAEPEGGPIWQGCAALAKKYNIYLSAGSMPERGADGCVYNTAYVFDRAGRQLAKHRKMHLFDIDVRNGQSFHESDTLSAGGAVTVFDTEFGKIGLCVCYDFRFPELGRLMALRGARLILVPAAFNPTTGPRHWELMFRAQAMFNQVFALGTAPALDAAASYRSWGHSIAVDPWGAVLAQLGDGEGEQLVELDLSETESVREQLPLLRHRRTDVYRLEETGGNNNRGHTGK